MPEVFIGSKVSTLKFIEQRVAQKVNSWRMRYLSLAGKETMIKAVALALPTYSMSCFLLPKSNCSEITKALAKFWWRNHKTYQGVHWLSWDKLTQPKQVGGLNFRDIHGFNLALLGKQIWRLSNNPQSLLARVYKGRYYPKSDALHAKKGYRASFAWRSIWQAQKLMQIGMKKQFGDGSQISFVEDPWLVDTLPKPPVFLQQFDKSQATTQYFLSTSSDEWNMTRLSEAFSDPEIALISQVKPCTSPPSQPYSWIFLADGCYTVKSGYHIWRTRLREHEQQIVYDQPSITSLYTKIWNLQVAPKLRHFLWRCISNILPTGDNMRKRRISQQTSCPRCGEGDENVNHMLFNCPFARVVWALSGYGILFYPLPSESIYANLHACLETTLRQPDDKLWAWVMWRLWKERNALCYGQPTREAPLLLQKAIEDAREGLALQSADKPQQVKPSKKTSKLKSGWTRPEPGILKCNIDASWSENGMTCGISWIVRNSDGMVRLYGVKSYPKLNSPLEAEAAALTWSLACIKNMGYVQVVMESDCTNLVAAINNPKKWPSLGGYLEDINRDLTLTNSRLVLISREANKAADILAKSVARCPRYYAGIDRAMPPWLSSIVVHEQGNTVVS